MSRLEQFINLPDVANIEVEQFVNAKYGKFRIKPMTLNQYRRYQQACRVTDKKGVASMDGVKFNLMVVLGHVIDPNFKDAEFLARVGCETGDEFIQRKILPGDATDMANAVIIASGFEPGRDVEDFEEGTERAKN